jgi:hypothetical protein
MEVSPNFLVLFLILLLFQYLEFLFLLFLVEKLAIESFVTQSKVLNFDTNKPVKL